MDMVADCSSASNHAKSVLPDDRIILLDVNYPASMGPAVSFARSAVNHSRIAYDSNRR